MNDNGCTKVTTVGRRKGSEVHLNPLQRISACIVNGLENFFYNWGYQVAKRPWLFIIACLLATIICSAGLLRFNPENRPEKLWIPWNSEFVANSQWLQKNFPAPIRFHNALLVADNVLEPEIIKIAQDLHKRINSFEVDGRRWEDVCFKLPVTKFLQASRRKREISSQNHSGNAQSNDIFDNFDEFFEDDFFKEPLSETTIEFDSPEASLSESTESTFDPSVSIPEDIYCEILAQLDEGCMEKNIAELWGFDEQLINPLKLQDVINKVNSETIRFAIVFFILWTLTDRPIFGRPVNYTKELGRITYNETGHIIGAKALFLHWFTKINQTALSDGVFTHDLGTGEKVDPLGLKWEKKWIDLLLNYELPEGVHLYKKVARSFGDISTSTIMGDGMMLGVGFSIVFMYVIVMLGQFNMVELRPFLSLAGLSCVALAIFVSYGICSTFRIIYGPVHNVLPFLLLGIGIDDMFVIAQCWNNLSPAERKKPLTERMGLTLKHAGVSITVTSVTDFAAFVIGGTTVLPALQSFCVYAAMGIAAIFVFQATFFVAWFSLDQKRIESHRNAILCCIKHKDFEPNKCSQTSYLQSFFEKIYSRILFNTVVKVLVVLMTMGLFGFCVWGNIELRQKFDPVWFLPQDSYLFKYIFARETYFNETGARGFIFIQNASFPENLPEVDELVTKLKASDQLHSVDDWYSEFKTYVNSNFNADVPNTPLPEKKFSRYLNKFLFSPSGSKYRAKFKTTGNITCGGFAPDIELSAIDFAFKDTHGPEEHLPMMHKVKNIVNSVNFTPEGQSRAFVWSFAFAGWETDEIITAELYRNMGLAMCCVLLTTLLLIANFTACILVLLCVVLTLVDVGGCMHFWGLTIDTVSCIDLVLAIGLCVDYAAHIAHAFMTSTGTRNERAKNALRVIGPAVLNGGFSTFLAFILLANSRSHVFITFFKIFFLVVLFGLFHGLVFLPVILSILGPAPYSSARDAHDDASPTYLDDGETLRPLRNGSKFIEAKGHSKNGLNSIEKFEEVQTQLMGGKRFDD